MLAKSIARRFLETMSKFVLWKSTVDIMIEIQSILQFYDFVIVF